MQCSFCGLDRCSSECRESITVALCLLTAKAAVGAVIAGGQLGRNNTVNIGDGAGTAMRLTDIDFGSGIKISPIQAGSASTCVITTTGTSRCFGNNNDVAGQGHTEGISDGSNSRTIASEGDVNQVGHLYPKWLWVVLI